MTRPGLVHQALLFETSDQFLASAVPFLVDGVRRGDAVIAVTSEANTELLRKHLDSAADHVTFLQAAGWYDVPGRALATYHRHVDALSDQHDRLRVLGEPVWAGRDPLETSDWGRYESVLNVALAAAPARVMCGYDCRALSTAVLDDARRTHPALAVGPDSRPSEEYADPARYYAERNVALTARPTSDTANLTGFSAPGPVRAFVQDHAARFGVPAHRLEDFTLAVNEIATNALRHGAGRGDAWLWVADNRVVCEINDAGSAPAGYLGFLRADPAADRGHGLWIARQLCDLLEMHYGRSGTTVRLHVRR